jgi:hypothetical protein
MFRFTIRDVLWLMVVVALGVGWYLDRRQLKSSIGDVEARLDAYERRAELRDPLRELDARVWPVVANPNARVPGGMPQPPSGGVAACDSHPARRAEVRAEIAKIETNPGTWKPGRNSRPQPGPFTRP